MSADPIIAAIVAVDMASVAHTATLVFRDEDDEADMDRSDVAGHVVDAAFQAVRQTMPTTLVGLLALVRFYARDAKIYCRWDTGGDYLEHVAAALTPFVAVAERDEANLISLVRHYGQACGELQAQRYLLAGTLDEMGVLS